MVGMEFDWVAADRLGRLALMATSGRGPLPDGVIHRVDEHRAMAEAILALGGNPAWADLLTLTGPVPVYVYDWDASAGAYRRMQSPRVERPLEVGDLPGHLQPCIIRLSVSFDAAESPGDLFVTLNNPQDSNADLPPLVRAIFEHAPEAVSAAVASGESPNGEYAGMCLVVLAAYHGDDEVLEALIRAGATVPRDALRVLGDQDITDWKIDPIELEEDYARVAQILLDHGATPQVLAYNGKTLIESFPAAQYPHLHSVLSRASNQ